MEPLRNLMRTQIYKTGKNESGLGEVGMKWEQGEGCVIALPSEKHDI